MWNPLKKKDENESEEEKKLLEGMPDTKDMNVIQRFAMNRIMKMKPEEREKLMKKAMTPKNVEKHKGEIIQQLETMRKSGQISDDQYRLAKKRFNI